MVNYIEMQPKLLSPIIFLDCDGVINNWHTVAVNNGYRLPYVIEPDLVKRLQRFVENRNALIVVTSTWRLTITKEEFIQVVGGWVAFHLMIGSAWKTGRDDRGFRGNEVRNWFNDNPNFEFYKYVIFDDDSDFHSDQPFVKVNGEFGLTETDLNKARDFLR